MLVTGKPENLPSTNALDNIPNPDAHSLQIPAIDATWVRFTGTSGDVIDNPPAIDEERTYILKGVCTGYDLRKRADKENRVVAIMDITSCYERGKVPIVDENQGSLFPPPAAEPSGDGDEDQEGEDDIDLSNVSEIRPPFSDADES